MTLAIAIYLFADAEVLDFAGPYEVFTTASRVHKRRVPEAEELFRVFTLAATPGLVRARAGMEVKADFGFDTHPPLDLLIVPGGVVTQELERPGLTEWIQRNHATTRITASVCTGAFLLAQAGLLEGLQVTTHWEDVADLRAMFPALQVLEGPRWVDQGRVVTSAGISAGIDMSLHLVERLAGRELALATARQMEVDWSQN